MSKTQWLCEKILEETDAELGGIDEPIDRLNRCSEIKREVEDLLRKVVEREETLVEYVNQGNRG